MPEKIKTEENKPINEVLNNLKRDIALDHEFVDSLDDKVRTLPPIAPDGSSPCSFASQLVEAKEEDEAVVAAHLSMRRKDLVDLDADISRSSKNLRTLQNTSNEIQVNGPRVELEEGEDRIKERLRKLLEVRPYLVALIERMELALAQASQRKSPGMGNQRRPPYSATTMSRLFLGPMDTSPRPLPSNPRPHDSVPSSDLSPSSGIDRRPPPAGLGEALSGLISLGPKGGKTR